MDSKLQNLYKMGTSISNNAKTHNRTVYGQLYLPELKAPGRQTTVQDNRIFTTFNEMSCSRNNGV